MPIVILGLLAAGGGGLAAYFAAKKKHGHGTLLAMVKALPPPDGTNAGGQAWGDLIKRINEEYVHSSDLAPNLEAREAYAAMSARGSKLAQMLLVILDKKIAKMKPAA